jgi:hypothetical protein
MTALLQSLNRIARDENVSLSIKEEQGVSAVRFWVYKLWDGPISPVNPATGYLGVLAKLDDAILVNGSKAALFDQVLQCVTAIGAKPHPASVFLEDWISSQDVQECDPSGPRSGEPAIALICRSPTAKDLTSEWLYHENLFASVETYSRLRRSSPFETIVLFGPPNRYESSRWVTSPDSDFKAQWLITAPPASKVVILTWPSHPRLNLDFVGPWQGYEPPAISAMEGFDNLSPVPVFEFIEKPQTHKANFNFAGETNVIAARQYEILGKENGLWVFFDDNLGPRPRILRPDFSQTHTPTNKQPLKPGTHLVFRSHDVEREHLLKASEEWWTETYSEFNFAQAEELKAVLKSRVQSFIDANGVDEFKRRLGNAGLSKDYSFQLHSRLSAPEYVAPNSADKYEAVCRAVDYRAPAGSYNLLGKLRTARQQAGLGLLRQLLFKIQAASDEGKLDLLTDHGFAKLYDEALGELFISTVTQLVSENAIVPLVKLGRPMDQGGALWLK